MKENVKKKIGIISILKVNNYGAELQAYALQCKLSQLGYDSEIIDYLFYKNKKHIKTKASKPWIDIGWKRKIKEFLYPIVYSIKTVRYYKDKKSRQMKFDIFHDENTKLSTKTYRSINELYDEEFDYDVFIVGSDQVWNPYTNTNLDPYFLTFAGGNKKCISYASSFGVSMVPEHYKRIFKTRLERFNAISVREKQAVGLINILSNKKAYHVLDPTLLLNFSEWNKIAIMPKQEAPYILLYILSSSTYATKLAEAISEQKGWQIIRICKEASPEDKNSKIKNITNAGPSEFLGLFINASMVITNSFHGSVFSVNFNIPFFTIISKQKTNNSRQESLLSLLKLENRLLIEGTAMPSTLDVDFSEANKILANEVSKSVDYLHNSIN